MATLATELHVIAHQFRTAQRHFLGRIHISWLFADKDEQVARPTSQGDFGGFGGQFALGFSWLQHFHKTFHRRLGKGPQLADLRNFQGALDHAQLIHQIVSIDKGYSRQPGT